MEFNNRIKFKKWICRMRVGQYDNGRIAIFLENDLGPIATATVNIPWHELPEGHVLIKDWSENSGMLEALVTKGIVEETGVRVATGFCEAHQCKLLQQP
jgi:hypothetical protein